mgnify:CR=1 FL=1
MNDGEASGEGDIYFHYDSLNIYMTIKNDKGRLGKTIPFDNFISLQSATLSRCLVCKE